MNEQKRTYWIEPTDTIRDILERVARHETGISGGTREILDVISNKIKELKTIT